MPMRTIESLDDEEWDRLIKEMEKGQIPKVACYMPSLKAKMPSIVEF